VNSKLSTVRWGRGGVVGLVVVAWVTSGTPVLAARAESRAAAPACTITGTRGADVLTGTAGDDVICGLGGDDRLSGRGGDDVLFGGGGDDVLRGGGGDDTVAGGGGADRLRGSEGRDTLSGGSGRDIVLYPPRVAPLRLSIGDGANDGARGESDNIAADVEAVRGGMGDDTLIGSRGANRLFGQGGDDHLVGAAGNDLLDGGSGRDLLDGRDSVAFADELVCGDGAGDRALADMADHVRAGCEVVVQNDAPVAVDDQVTTDEDTEVVLPVTGVGSPAANDTDADADPLTVTAVAAATGGSVAIVAGTIRFEPMADLCGASVAGFDYQVSDGGGGTDVGRVTVSVTCVDDPPTAVDDNATVNEDSGATTIDVLANDTDVEGGPEAIDDVTQPANGTVTVTNLGAELTYEPDPNFCSATPEAFTYTLSPGGSAATVSVTVICVPDTPVAVDDTATVDEDSGATTIDVLANDRDPDPTGITIDDETQPANGTVTVPSGGADLRYQPDPNYCNTQTGGSPDTFTYRLAPGGSTATVSVTVTCGDDSPTAVDDTATVVEDSGATTIDVLANDTDVDGGPKAIDDVTQPANGTAVVTGGGTGLTYQPDPDFCGATPDTFTYTLNGGDSATVSVTVTCFVAISTSLSSAPAAPAINQTFSYTGGLVNSGITPLDEVTMTFDVPVQMNIDSVTTGTYTGFEGDQAGVGVLVRYEKNTAPGVFTLWGASPNTTTNTTLTDPPPGVGAGEFVTRVRWEYGPAAPGASATINPTVRGQIINPDNVGNTVTTNTAVQSMVRVSGVYTAGPTTVNDDDAYTFNPSP
jgi:hypothetical protein